MTSQFFQLSESERQQLLFAPLCVFEVVAGADGTIDKKEIEVLYGFLGAAHKSELMTAVLGELQRDIDAKLAAHSSNSIPSYQRLAGAAETVSRQFSPEEARTFLAELMVLGRRVAEASGGILGFGQKISEQELSALKDLASILQYTTTPSEKRVNIVASEGMEASNSVPSEGNSIEFHEIQAKLSVLSKSVEEARKTPQFLSIEAIDGIASVLALREKRSSSDGMNFCVYKAVSMESVESWGKSPQELFQIALKNSFDPNAKIFSSDGSHPGQGPTVQILETSSPASLVALSLDDYPEMLGSYGAIVGIPTKNSVVSIPIVDETWPRNLGLLANYVEAIFNDPDYKPFSSQLFLFRKRGRLHQIGFDVSQDDEGPVIRVIIKTAELAEAIQEMQKEMTLPLQ
jgi:hypothetical protein